jgi:hypothetical protein
MTIHPYIRKYNYISDFYDTIYRYYSNVYQAYPITYYSIDWKNSTLDKNELLAGSYEKYNVGDLSGVKFNKILMLPVGNVEQMQPQQESGDSGLHFSSSLIGGFTIPTTINLKPLEGDIVHFSQDFMMREKNIGPLYVVTNMNLATFGDLNVYQLRIKVIGSKLTEVEKQISNYLMFLEHTKNIHPITNAELLLKLQDKNNLLAERLNNLFHNSGFYIN